MASYRKRGQIWYFRFVNADGDKIERRGCTDKRATQAMAHAAETEAAQIRNGFVDAKRLTFARSAAVSLWEHVRDFEAHLIDRGDTRAHATLYVGRLRRLAALACGARLADIDPGKRARHEDRERADRALESALRSGRLASLTLLSVQTALASLRDSGRGANTLNHHRAAVRGFILWARKTGRIQDDPLLGLASFSVKEDLRHDRRTISLDELRRLVEAAHSGPTFREMTGPARALCYRLAVASGLRFSELKSIVPESFDFERPTPTVTVLAGFAKNGQTATLPLPRDLADDLRPWVATIPKDRPVFLLPANDGAAMLRVDLGAANIPYKDGAGRPFDFHSLRCMLATMADQAGVSPRIVQRLMRHSKLEMTDRYTRPRLADIERASATLPSLAPNKEGPKTLAATGTEGPIKTSPLVLAHYLPTGGPGNSRDVSHVDVVTGTNNPPSMGRNSLEITEIDALGRDVADDVASDRGGARTHDQRINLPSVVRRKINAVKPLRLPTLPLAHHLPTDTRKTDPELAIVIASWDRLPAPIRAAVLALVRAARETPR